MPAPAVIPAPIAYINAAAVKKLVVGSRVGQCKVALFVRLGSDRQAEIVQTTNLLTEETDWD